MGNETCQPPSYHSSIVWITAFQCVLAFLALIGNSLVIYAVWKSARLRTAPNYFVVSLAAGDLLVALHVPIYNVFYFVTQLACQKKFCLLRYWLTTYTAFCSSFSLMGVAVDRYVSIIHGISYYRLVTHRLVVGYIIFVWLFFLIVSSFPLMGLGDNKGYPSKLEAVVCDVVYVYTPEFLLVIAGMFLISTTVTLALYGFIFRASLKQLKAVAAGGDPNRRIKQEARTACTMALVLAGFVVGFLPYCVTAILSFVTESSLPIVLGVKPYATSLYFGISALNPVIYGWKAKAFREEFLDILRFRK